MEFLNSIKSKYTLNIYFDNNTQNIPRVSQANFAYFIDIIKRKHYSIYINISKVYTRVTFTTIRNIFLLIKRQLWNLLFLK